MRFSHVYCPDDINNTFLSQGYILEKAPTVGIVGKAYIPKTGGEEPPMALV